MYGHLVAVEVGVVGDADQRMELDCLTLDEHRLECLDTKPMERRGALPKPWMLADNIIEDVPDILAFFLDHLLGALDASDVALLFELAVDERLEQLERHLLRQAALMEPEFRADDDNRTSRIVDPLAKQVLAEAPGLALEHIAQRLERPLGGARDRAPPPAGLEQALTRLLQHPLFVSHDDIRRLQFDQPL